MSSHQHAGTNGAAFQAIAKEYDWELLIVTKSSCVFGWEERPDQERCGEWNHNFIDWLDDNPVDLVVTPGTRLDEPEYILEAAPQWWDRITNTGTDLLLVRGTPRAASDIPDCLAQGGTPQECGPTKQRFAETNPLEEMDLPDGTYTVDMTPYVCPQIDNPNTENCDAVVGNILVWYDSHHFTTPFSQSLAPGFETKMRETVGWLFD